MELLEAERRLLHRIILHGPLRPAHRDLQPARNLEERGFVRSVVSRRSVAIYVTSGAGIVAERDLPGAALTA